MPAKRRSINRPATSAAHLLAWDAVFRFGGDYFCRATMMFNYSEPYLIPRKDIAAAWKTYGRDFMATWEPDPKGRQVPWAYTEFGPPE